MIDAYEVISKNKLAYKHKLTPESPKVLAIDQKIKSNTLDFSSNTFRKFDKRLVTQFNSLSAENVVLLHLKHKLRRTFSVSFTNRNRVVDQLFDKLRALRSLNDATIIRFDLQSYFYTVETRYIFERYLQDSTLDRSDKDYLEDICAANRYCIAGLPIFNYFIELISRDLDDVIKSKLSRYGLVMYARYVDDGIIILNKCLSKRRAREIINEAIDDIFKNKQNYNKVKINEKKFTVINKRYLRADCSFDFLGYEFFLRNNFKDLKIGIVLRKRNKYQEKVDKLIKQNYNPANSVSRELVRHMLKAHCSRVVYFAPSSKHRGVWVSKGIIASYNRLKDYDAHIDRQTVNFLRNIYRTSFRKNGFTPPEYLNNPRYDLYSCILVNKTLIFNELIGASKDSLIKSLAKIGYQYSPSTDYNFLVKDYLIHIKSGY